ncbi:MAG: SDR family oxidoreductase [Pseudomonadota bacterium]
MSKKPIALVTGAAQGIGYACAKALIDDGCEVVICDIDAQKLAQAQKTLGLNAKSVICDMAEADQIISMFDDIEKQFGPVEILVNNAGIAYPDDFLNYDLAVFDKVLNVNLRSVFIATQRAAKTMVAKSIKGAIINVSSINAVVAIPTIPAYCASKGGVTQLTKVAALALAPHHIRVNAVGPGSVETQMVAQVNNDAQAKQKILSRTPLKRLAQPHEIADIVVFLAGSKASYITGETIYADGGRIAMNYTC